MEKELSKDEEDEVPQKMFLDTFLCWQILTNTLKFSGAR